MDTPVAEADPARAAGAWQALVVGGSVAAILDLGFATGFAAWQGMPPQTLLQMIASGLLGQAAYEGGAATAAAGAACHVALSFLWAAGYLLAARRWRVLDTRYITAGLAFGVLVFFAMRLVVLPLSAFPHPVVFRPLAWAADLVSHMVLFGLPIALAARWFSASAAPRPRR